jgi:hypothetical protein
MITQQRAFRGMYRNGDPSLSSAEWVEANIHGHGPLGDLYPNYDGGDPWARTLGKVRGIKEGDTPSFLALVPNGLTDFERPWLSSWGGHFEGEAARRTDVPDPDLDTTGDIDPRTSSVYRWRPAFQADFQARLDWCIKPRAEANHPPVVRIAGDRERAVEPGQAAVLDASGTTDPDGDGWDASWSLDPAAAPDLARTVVIEGRDQKVARVTIAQGRTGKSIPILLTVTDRGEPRLTRYGRIFLQLRAEGPAPAGAAGSAGDGPGM